MSRPTISTVHDPGTEIPSEQPYLGCVHIWTVTGYKMVALPNGTNRLVELVRLERCEPLPAGGSGRQ